MIFEELKDVLDREFYSISDGHLTLGARYRPTYKPYSANLVTNSSFDVIRPERFKGQKLRSCRYGDNQVSLTQLLKKFYDPTTKVLVYKAIKIVPDGKPEPLFCRFTTTEETTFEWNAMFKRDAMLDRKAMLDRNSLKSHTDRGVPVLTIPSFLWNNGAKPEDFRSTAADSQVTGSRIILLDFRGNEGGDAFHFVNWLRDITGVADLPMGADYYGNFNNVIEHVARIQAKDTKFTGPFLDIYYQLLVGGHPDVSNKMPYRYFSYLESNPKFSGTFVVVADNVCRSACENAIATLLKAEKKLGLQVKLVGQNTDGAQVIGANYTIKLPNSGLSVFVGTWIDKKREGKPQELKGYVPDVWLPLDFDVSTHADDLLQALGLQKSL